MQTASQHIFGGFQNASTLSAHFLVRRGAAHHANNPSAFLVGLQNPRNLVMFSCLVSLPIDAYQRYSRRFWLARQLCSISCKVYQASMTFFQHLRRVTSELFSEAPGRVTSVKNVKMILLQYCDWC